VLTANPKFQAGGISLASSLEQALELADNEASGKAFVIGGGQIYKLFLPWATSMEITEVADAPTADTFFPNFSSSCFQETARISNTSSDPEFDYVSYKRV
jgi:dihydrofolate reductase